MLSPAGNSLTAELEAAFGAGRAWTSRHGSSATVWETAAYQLMWSAGALSETELRRLWEDRKGPRAYSLILLAPSDDPSKVRVIGPQDARPMRELPAGRVLALLDKSRDPVPGQGVQAPRGVRGPRSSGQGPPHAPFRARAAALVTATIPHLRLK